MEKLDAIGYVRHVVDDSGAGRALGFDPHAIVRNPGAGFEYNAQRLGWDIPAANGFAHPSRIVVFPIAGRPVAVAVHSYLDVTVTDSEALEMARDYLQEIGKLPAGDVAGDVF